MLVQLLSEPSGGSDLAGVITRAERRGDTWVINGAKTWSTSAFAADYGLLLARTDWSVPKHDGLTMFMAPINAPGVTLRRISRSMDTTNSARSSSMTLKSATDAVVGEVNNGWAVASRQLYHERRAVGRGSEFASGRSSESTERSLDDLLVLANASGVSGSREVQAAIGRVLARRIVRDRLVGHISGSVADGSLPPAAGSIIRLFHSDLVFLEVDTALNIAADNAVIDVGDDLLKVGERYLSRQTVALGGGSNEMARNVIGERVLGFPREYAADRGVPFNEVRHNKS